MARRTKHFETHDFYCMNCGNKAIPIMRNNGFDHAKHHRKKLYCPFCKHEVNHIEVKNLEDKEWFLEQFKKGMFKEEVRASLLECEG